MSIWKKLLIVFASILATLFLVIDIWYLYILFFAPEKINSYTQNFDMQVAVKDDGETLQKNIIEINYYSNRNNNGFEVFEIKFNTLKDENLSMLVSKGYQYVAPANSKLNFDWGADRILVDEYQTGSWFWSTDYNYYTYSYYSNGSEFQYTTDNLSETSFISTNELNDDTLFKINVGSVENPEIVGLKFKGKDTPLNDDTLVAKQSGHIDLIVDRDYYEVYHYIRYDMQYFANLMYNSIQSLACGTNHTIAFDFGDLFKYYKCSIDDSSYIENLTDSESTKVINDINNYFGVKVYVSEDGMQRSSDSIFGIFQGSSDFNVNPEIGEIDYFTGKSIINVSLKDFVLVSNGSNKATAVLSNEFISRYSDYKDDILLTGSVNADEIYNSHNIEIVDYDFNGFKLHDNSSFGVYIFVGDFDNGGVK